MVQSLQGMQNMITLEVTNYQSPLVQANDPRHTKYGGMFRESQFKVCKNISRR